MASARVVFTGEAREDLRDLDNSVRQVVIKAANKLKTDPELRGQPLGSKSTGNLTSFRKLVAGDRDYRIIYRVEADGTVVVVWVVGARADEACYELALSRLRLHQEPGLAEELARVLREAWA